MFKDLVLFLRTIGSYNLNLKRDFDKAIKFFEMVLKLESSNTEAQYNLAASYINKYYNTIKDKDPSYLDKAEKLLKNILDNSTNPKELELSKEAINKISELRKTSNLSR
ncbi:MAG: hypothetical protein NC912_05130 [Candidatus Omnitrophica bacterium]|nr:hypothetical protein [Candidatus Omnitrophota bacterium]